MKDKMLKKAVIPMLIIGLIITIAMPKEAHAATKYYVNYDYLNVRKGPGAHYKYMGRLTAGQQVNVYSLKGGWARIKYKKKKAYVCAYYLSKVVNKPKVSGWICKDGIWDYYKNGALIPSAWGTHEAATKIAGTYSGSNYKIAVSRSRCMMYVFKACAAGWEPYKQWACCVGKRSTPTPKGGFSISYKMKKMDSVLPNGLKSTEFYTSVFSGDYCIHSTLYKYGAKSPDSNLNIDSRLGAQISNGCIRLSTENAKWLYNNAPSGTSIYIY